MAIKHIAIESKEELAKFLSEQAQAVESLKGKVSALESTGDQYTEKIKSLTLLAKGNYVSGSHDKGNIAVQNKFGKALKLLCSKGYSELINIRLPDLVGK